MVEIKLDNNATISTSFMSEKITQGDILYLKNLDIRISLSNDKNSLVLKMNNNSIFYFSKCVDDYWLVQDLQPSIIKYYLLDSISEVDLLNHLYD